LAVEGEPGDRMWLITQGAVDIRFHVNDPRMSRRLASLGTGTTVGEMSLIEATPRSASIVAAEDVVCWELDRNRYDEIMQRHPNIGTKILTNLMRTLVRRIRTTSEELREMEN